MLAIAPEGHRPSTGTLRRFKARAGRKGLLGGCCAAPDVKVRCADEMRNKKKKKIRNESDGRSLNTVNFQSAVGTNPVIAERRSSSVFRRYFVQR